MKNTIIKNILIVLLTVITPLVASAALWTGPDGNPPNYNVEAPVNVGDTYQVKGGDLGVIRLFMDGVYGQYVRVTGLEDNSVTPPNTNGPGTGTVSARQYCFNNGYGRNADCITAWPTGGLGGGIMSIIAGTNITVDDTDPQNPIISSTASGGPGGTPDVQQNGVVISSDPTFLNFTGSRIVATPDASGVKITVLGTPVQKNGAQVAPNPTALNFTGLNMSAVTSLGNPGVVDISVTPMAIRKNGIQVSASPLALNFIGNNITTTNTGGIVDVSINSNLLVQKDGAAVGSGFSTLNFAPSTQWNITDTGSGVAKVEYLGAGAGPTGLALPSASPADKILRSDGTNWVQSPLVKHTISSFQVNRPVADNAADNIFQAAKQMTVFGNPLPVLGLFVNKDGDTTVNGARFRNYGISGTTASPTNSFGADDIFQAGTGVSNQKGVAVRADGNVRVRGELSAASNAVVPLSSGLFLGANDIFHVVGELGGVKKGFGLAVDGTTRVEGLLAVNGGQVLIGDKIHVGNTDHTGNTEQTGNTLQIGNYTMQGLGATMTLGNSTNTAQLNILGNTNQIGDYSLSGDIAQTGDHSLQGDIIQTGNISQFGNINTTGRWAVSDINPPTSFPPFTPVPYSFLASVGSGGSLGTLGIDRQGKTKVVGFLQVTGPATVSGNLQVDGYIQTDTLTNTNGNLTVCADTSGRLKLCTQPLPSVVITSTGLTNNEFTRTRIVHTAGQTTVPNFTQAATVSYTVSATPSTGSPANVSCNRTTTQGSANNWNATSVTASMIPSSVVNQPIQVTSYGPTTLTVTCTNTAGQSASSSVTIYGHGSWLWANVPGTISYTFPQIPLQLELWGAGGGAGGRYSDGTNMACGGGGGAGQTLSATRQGGLATVIIGAGGSAGGNSVSNGSAATNGGIGGQTIFTSTVPGIGVAGGEGGFAGRSESYQSGNSYIPIYIGGTTALNYGTGGTAGSTGVSCFTGTGKTPWTTISGYNSLGRGGGPSTLTGGAGGILVSW